MTRLLAVHPVFEDVWPYAVDHLADVWGIDVDVRRVSDPDRERTIDDHIDDPEGYTQLVSLGIPVSPSCLDEFDDLEEAFVMTDTMYSVDEDVTEQLQKRGVQAHELESEGFWSPSVAEFALALTVNGLRRIPQKSRKMIDSHDPWDLDQLDNELPGACGHQFGDDPSFVNGSIDRKRIGVVGVGNIGSRYVDVVDSLGADVSAYDPYADEPCFHRTGAEKSRDLYELAADSDIFAPMVPLTESTRDLVSGEHINALPDGALLVLVTRAGICDMEAVRERVLNDEISLAADVWDEEPLPLDDPLLGRDNVVHTPHIAGRTRDANERWAEHVAGLFNKNADDV